MLLRFVYWVVGRNSVGKTTFCRAQKGWQVYPGQACREKWGEAPMMTSANPLTPVWTEGFVRELVERGLRGFVDDKAHGAAFVDGFPKSAGQVEFARFVGDELGCISRMLLCRVDEEERKQRQARRHPDAVALAQARDALESGALYEVVEAAGKESIPLTIIDTRPDDTNWQPLAIIREIEELERRGEAVVYHSFEGAFMPIGAKEDEREAAWITDHYRHRTLTARRNGFPLFNLLSGFFLRFCVEDSRGSRPPLLLQDSVVGLAELCSLSGSAVLRAIWERVNAWFPGVEIILPPKADRTVEWGGQITRRRL